MDYSFLSTVRGLALHSQLTLAAGVRIIFGVLQPQKISAAATLGPGIGLCLAAACLRTKAYFPALQIR